nr:NADH dehydrogenase subunit 2 [Fenusa sp. 1 GYN-2023a]
MMKFLKPNKIINSSMINMHIMMWLTIIFMIYSSSWFNAWLSMEMNLMSFIPLMMNNSKNKISNSMMMYFIIQASSSSMMMMMIILMKMNMYLNKMMIINMIIQISLMMKMGAAPLHWWMPKMMNNLSWMNCLILMTLQKIGPMYLISTTNNTTIMYMFSLMSTYIGSIVGMNQTSIKLIMMYSSLSHMGWMIMSLMMSLNLMFIYFLIYSLITLMITMLMNNMKFNYLNDLFKNNSSESIFKKMMSMSLLLSISGLPPFLGFLPKIITLIFMMKNMFYMEMILFIMMSMLSLWYYMNPLMSMFLTMKINSKWNKNNKYLYKMMMTIMLINMMPSMFITNFLLNM